MNQVTSWLPLARATAIGWMPLSKSPMPLNQTISTENLGLHCDSKVIINISGKRFEVFLSSLNRYPHTLLGSCERDYFYDDDNEEYYFDRDPDIFRYILSYYRCGHLHFPKQECVAAFDEELCYFRISSDVIQDCCYEDYQDCRKENYERFFVEKPPVNEKDLINQTCRQQLWHAFENPEASTVALVIYYVTGFFIAISVLANVIETVPCTYRPETERHVSCGELFEQAFFCLDTGCVAIFTVEYLARLVAAPRRWRFFKSIMSLIDVVAILPFYVGLLMANNKVGFLGVWVL